MKLAEFWKQEGEKVQCELCPRRCVISPGLKGVCGARKNIDGKLYSIYYGKPASVAIDPIEKKPLFHFLPGSKSLSFGTLGCNLKCMHCQNWQISQAHISEDFLQEVQPEEIVTQAIKTQCKSISFTYTEPTIFYEYMYDIAKLAKKKGLKTVMVSNGYINKKPMEKLAEYIDAANIDIKGFTEDFYQKVCKASLQPVLETLKLMKKKGVWLEITNLIIPSYNDKPGEIRKMCKWIVENLGKDVPLHFSAFYPNYQLTDVREATFEDLKKACAIAKDEGLRFIYMGNVYAKEAENSYCPACKSLLISRRGFDVLQNNLKKGRCKCGEKIPGVWE